MKEKDVIYRSKIEKSKLGGVKMVDQKETRKNDKIEKQILREKLEVILEALKEVAKIQPFIKTPECLSFKQMLDYIKGAYTGEELEKIFRHTTSCHYCFTMEIKLRRALEERAVEEIRERETEVAARCHTFLSGVISKIVEDIAEKITKGVRIFAVQMRDELLHVWNKSKASLKISIIF